MTELTLADLEILHHLLVRYRSQGLTGSKDPEFAVVLERIRHSLKRYNSPVPKHRWRHYAEGWQKRRADAEDQ